MLPSTLGMELHSSSFTFLPYDILREIILYTAVFTMKRDQSYQPLLHFQVVSPPIVPSHVCRSWRHALLSDPTMWTCISIPDMKPSFIIELLHRSGSSSLNVFLVLKRSLRSMREFDGVQNMLSSLFEQMHRFKILYICMQATFGKYSKPLQVLYEHVLSYLPQPAPRLQMFFCWYLDCFNRLDETHLDPLFSGNAPNLKHIYQILSLDLREINRPLFHDLFELHLYLPHRLNLDYNRFFDLLELSPRLKLLHINANWHAGFVSVPFEFPSTRKINFPNLTMLVLEMNFQVELLNAVLETVAFPPNIKWQITSQCRLGNSSPICQYLSRARFTSLAILFSDSENIHLSFEEDFASDYINQFDGSTLKCIYEDIWDLIDLWGPLMESIKSSEITRLSLNVESMYPDDSELFECQVFPTIVASAPMRNLESLTFKYGNSMLTSYNDTGLSLSILSKLLPDLEKITASEYNMNTTTAGDINPAQDLDLDLISIDSEGDLPSPDLNAATSFINPAFPFPRLHELRMELGDSFEMAHAIILRTCTSLRREEGYPLQVSVHCGEMKEGVGLILQPQDTSDVHVTVSPDS